MYFAKLNLKHKISESDFKIVKENVSYGSLTHYSVDFNKIEILKSILPKEVRDDFHYSLMTANGTVSPHIDSDVTVGINFYIETGDCLTTFYKKSKNSSSYKIDVQTDGEFYLEDGLEVVAEFKAENNDIYLLDLKKIHSVKNEHSKNFLRKTICLQSVKYTFEETKSFLNRFIL
jgi:hypothetical protein